MMCDQHIRLRDSSVWDCGSALSRRSGTQLEVNTVKVKNQLLIWFEYTNEMSVVLYDLRDGYTEFDTCSFPL